MFNVAGQQGNIPCTATGTNAISLAPNTNYYAPAAYTDKQIVSWQAAANSTGSVTMQLNGLGFVNYYNASGIQAGSGDIVSGTGYVSQYLTALNSGGGGFITLNATVTAIAQPVQGDIQESGSDGGRQYHNDADRGCSGIAERVGRHRASDQFCASRQLRRQRSAPMDSIPARSRHHMVCLVRHLQCQHIDRGRAVLHLVHITDLALGLHLCGPSRRLSYRRFGQSLRHFAERPARSVRDRHQSDIDTDIGARHRRHFFGDLAGSCLGFGGGFGAAECCDDLILAGNVVYGGNGPNSTLFAPSTAWGGTNNGPQGSNGNSFPFWMVPSGSVLGGLTTSMLLEATTIGWSTSGLGGIGCCNGMGAGIMTKVSNRYLVAESGAMRHVAHYVYDPRDLRDGRPPGWFLPQGEPIVPEQYEIEFDHIPTDIEIRLAFMKRKSDGQSNQE